MSPWSYRARNFQPLCAFLAFSRSSLSSPEKPLRRPADGLLSGGLALGPYAPVEGFYGPLSVRYDLHGVVDAPREGEEPFRVVHLDLAAPRPHGFAPAAGLAGLDDVLYARTGRADLRVPAQAVNDLLGVGVDLPGAGVGAIVLVDPAVRIVLGEHEPDTLQPEALHCGDGLLEGAPGRRLVHGGPATRARIKGYLLPLTASAKFAVSPGYPLVA